MERKRAKEGVGALEEMESTGGKAEQRRVIGGGMHHGRTACGKDALYYVEDVFAPS